MSSISPALPTELLKDEDLPLFPAPLIITNPLLTPKKTAKSKYILTMLLFFFLFTLAGVISFYFDRHKALRSADILYRVTTLYFSQAAASLSNSIAAHRTSYHLTGNITTSTSTRWQEFPSFAIRQQVVSDILATGNDRRPSLSTWAREVADLEQAAEALAVGALNDIPNCPRLAQKLIALADGADRASKALHHLEAKKVGVADSIVVLNEGAILAAGFPLYSSILESLLRMFRPQILYCPTCAFERTSTDQRKVLLNLEQSILRAQEHIRSQKKLAREIEVHATAANFTLCVRPPLFPLWFMEFASGIPIRKNLCFVSTAVLEKIKHFSEEAINTMNGVQQDLLVMHSKIVDYQDRPSISGTNIQDEVYVEVIRKVTQKVKVEYIR